MNLIKIYVPIVISAITLAIIDVMVFRGPVIFVFSYIFTAIAFLILIVKKHLFYNVKYLIVHLILVNVFICLGATIHNRIIVSYIQENRFNLPLNKSILYHNYRILPLAQSAVFEQFGWFKKIYNYKDNLVEDRTLD